jgi:hypothetical protein
VENKIPFTSYDFWAYLSAGFLLLFVADYVTEANLLARDSWTIVQGVVAVSTAYAVGQLVASASALIFERILVGRLLGYPRDILFGRPKAWGWIKALMPGYFQALPDETRKAALKKGATDAAKGPGDALFWAAYAHARTTPVVMARLDNFLNLYGFCRNTAFVAFLGSALLYWSYRCGNGPAVNLYWSWAALAAGAGMTLRYLKFFSHYSVEVFTAYAYSKDVARRGK